MQVGSAMFSFNSEELRRSLVSGDMMLVIDPSLDLGRESPVEDSISVKSHGEGRLRVRRGGQPLESDLLLEELFTTFAFIPTCIRDKGGINATFSSDVPRERSFKTVEERLVRWVGVERDGKIYAERSDASHRCRSLAAEVGLFD